MFDLLNLCTHVFHVHNKSILKIIVRKIQKVNSERIYWASYLKFKMMGEWPSYFARNNVTFMDYPNLAMFSNFQW